MLLLNNFTIGQLETGKGALNVLFVLATAGVWLGVWLENERFSKSVQSTGWRLLVGCLGAEVLITVLIMQVDADIGRRQKHQIISLQQEAANRDITPDELNQDSSKLSEFSGQTAKIIVFPVNFESNWIAQQIFGILLNAHWNVSPPELLSAPPDQFMVQGIWIGRSNDDASKRAAKALRDALNSTVSQASGRGDDDTPLFKTFHSPLVLIMVGDKPAPLRSWVKP
jgi:hypothetical protein